MLHTPGLSSDSEARERGEALIIELERAHTPEDYGHDETCGICGEEFRVEVVCASLTSEDDYDLGLACPLCVTVLGQYRPEKFPTVEEYVAANRRITGPIWGSVGEASASWEAGEPYWAALEASRAAVLRIAKLGRDEE